jgi:calcineurin-like phosphoesterase family protein
MHRNVITYCNRPYKDVDEMNEAMVAHWNKTVGKKDIIYILGDFSLNPKVATRFAEILNGYKILISGNHDATFVKHKKHKKMIQKYLDNGFDEVYQNKIITLKNGMNVRLSHLPYRTEEALQYDTRYIDYRPHDDGMFLLHGHLHGRYRKMGRLLDVGIDAHQKILSEDEVIKFLESNQEFIPSPLTEHYKNRPNRENMEGM